MERDRVWKLRSNKHAKAENHHFLGYQLKVVFIFVEASRVITEVSPDLKKGNNLFINRIQNCARYLEGNLIISNKTLAILSFCIEACKRQRGF